MLNVEGSGDHKFYIGAGCDRCFQTGYRGRTGVYELMLINEQIRDMIHSRENAGTIKESAISGGLQTLRMDGARKVIVKTTIQIPEKAIVLIRLHPL